MIISGSEKNKDIGTDIRFILFKAYLLITAFLGLIFAVIHLINQRPLVNFLTAIVVAVVCFSMYVLTSRFGKYHIIRPIYIALLTVIYIPFGYWSSPGMDSAMLYLTLLTIFMTTFVAVKPWEYVLPLLGLIISFLMIQTEVLYPEHYAPYTDMSVRAIDITINYGTVTLTIMLTIIYVMRQYRKHNDMLYDLSIKDSLTGLYNRRFFNDFISSEYKKCQKNETVFSLIFIDLNHFKHINDHLGHTEGDHVLQQVAGIIQGNIRTQDIAARFGGDEFVIVLPNTDKKEAAYHSKKIIQVFHDFSAQYSKYDFSVGYGIEDSIDKDVTTLIKLADQALYRNKSVQKQDNQ